jgi:hypothetical protein
LGGKRTLVTGDLDQLGRNLERPESDLRPIILVDLKLVQAAIDDVDQQIDRWAELSVCPLMVASLYGHPL